MTEQHKKSLGVLAITMINVIAVDSLRTLPFSAEYGLSLVFYYALGALLFFLPVALVSAELATAWPNKGGIYVWVRQAFGERWGFWIIWLQWLYNVVWYPTALTFIAGAMAYLVDPSLTSDRFFMFGMCQALFWGATLFNCLGMRAATSLSTFAALFGTLVPMLIIILLGADWVIHGRVSQIAFHAHDLLPHHLDWHHFSFLVAVLFGLMGMEMSASHADEVKDAGKTYPRAIAFSSVIILTTLVLASLSIAIIVPHRTLNVVTGFIQAFHGFLSAYHIMWLEPWIVLCVIIGGLGGVAAWIIGPTKGLLVAAQDGVAPDIFAQVNRQGMPVMILFIQAIILSALSSLYIFMPTVKSTYWLLTAMTAQIAMLVYMGLFASAWVLRLKAPQQPRPFRIPGGMLGMSMCCGVGFLTCAAAIVLGFVPPSQFGVGHVAVYDGILLTGIAVIALTPWLFKKKHAL